MGVYQRNKDNMRNNMFILLYASTWIYIIHFSAYLPSNIYINMLNPLRILYTKVAIGRVYHN